MSSTIVIALAVGLVAGILSGMLGVGGSLVTIPGMVLLLGVDQPTAQGVSLTVIVFTALVAALAHYRRGNVDLNPLAWLCPVAVVFAFLGAWAAGMLSPHLLSQLFAALLLVIGLIMILTPGGQGVGTK